MLGLVARLGLFGLSLSFSLSLSVRLSVGGETRIKQLPKTAQKVKTQPNGFARKRNKTTQRNEMSKLRFQVLATVGLLLLLLLPSHFHCQPHPQAPHNRTPAYTHTFCLVACVLPWQCVSLCHFLQFVRKTTLVVKIFNTCCILLGASGRGRSGCACYAIAWKRCLNI